MHQIRLKTGKLWIKQVSKQVNYESNTFQKEVNYASNTFQIGKICTKYTFEKKNILNTVLKMLTWDLKGVPLVGPIMPRLYLCNAR